MAKTLPTELASDYETVALAKATEQGLTAADVRALGYAAIAALAGVELGPNGESPADFFYIQVRNYVANELHAGAAQALKARQREKLEASLVLLSLIHI